MIGADVEAVLVRRAVAFDLGAEVVAGGRGDGSPVCGGVGWIGWCGEGEGCGEEEERVCEKEGEEHCGGVWGVVVVGQNAVRGACLLSSMIFV